MILTGPIKPAHIELEAVPAFNDNYIWCFRRVGSPLTWVVDPGQATPAVSYLADNDLELAGILLTHHHPDHTGGVRQLISESWRGKGDCPVYGNAAAARPDRIPHINRSLKAGDSFEAAGLTFNMLLVPGHTLDHAAFFTETPLDLVDTEQLHGRERAASSETAGARDSAMGRPLLFCGDTLFSAGCGRLFEGTPEQMLNSLDSLAALPGQTLVCCGHEYTLANLAFTADAWPDNTTIAAYRAACEQLRESGMPTLPSSLAIERRINPFLNPQQTRYADSSETGEAHRLQAFARLRAAKDKA